VDTKRRWHHIQKENVSDISCKNATLNGSTNSDGFIGVDTFAGVTAENQFHGLPNLWHMGHTTHQDNLVHLAGFHTSIGQGLLAWIDGMLD
ncbi:NAD-specific glutamate dehydrogenase-domain-containing protein, partial [Pisolithus microcarpus]